MKRLVILGALALAPALAAEEGGPHSEPSIWWKWANFALLAGGLGYLISRHAGPFFSSRTAAIRSGLADAAAVSQQADARVAGIERRLANLGAEIERLRAESREEMSAEIQRIRAETARLAARTQASAESEIASIVKLARRELKAHSAALAVQLAEVQIRERLSGVAQEGLIRQFVSDLASTRPATR
ncbi:MAG: hypothetical protein HY235_16595 [Acidobacteria bacterium]|nr:hypothetical protein [Acidobacteriota bacterium]